MIASSLFRIGHQRLRSSSTLIPLQSKNVTIPVQQQFRQQLQLLCLRSRRYFVGSTKHKRYQKLRAKKVAKEGNSAAAPAEATVGAGTINASENFLQKYILPIRYRFTPPKGEPGQPYGQEHAKAFATRLPLWLALAFFFSWEETSPYTLITIRGPSMLPTMAADGSDVWLRSTWTWWRKLGQDPPYKLGDLVGFAHPDHSHHVSCKRIVGLPGDVVQRYGQYVHLYVDQDPEHWGITYPDTTDPVYQWINPNWDPVNICLRDKQQEMKRTLVVPEGHVWVEADCPALGIDSRQFGPIPISWLRGKVVAKLWPFWHTGAADTTNVYAKDKRPHPIPLDKETLMEHNVFRLKPQTVASKD